MAAMTSCDVMYLEAAADVEMKKNVPHVSSFLRHLNNIGFLRTAKTVTVLNISAHFLISCIYFFIYYLILLLATRVHPLYCTCRYGLYKQFSLIEDKNT